MTRIVVLLIILLLGLHDNRGSILKNLNDELWLALHPLTLIELLVCHLQLRSFYGIFSIQQTVIG